MKKFILLALVVMLLSLTITPCFADSFASMDISKSSPSLSYIFSLNDYFKLNSSFIINSDKDTTDLGTSSDGNYTRSKKEFNDLQIGCDLLWFPFSKVFFIGKGAYVIDRESIVTSAPVDPDSGLPGIKDKTNDTHFKSPWSAGFQFDTQNFIFGLGYHEMKKWYVQMVFPLGNKKSED